MARVFQSLGFCLALTALAVGCGQSSLGPAISAPQADIETRVLPPKPRRELPRLIAPPPAYGNKIVMAQRSSFLGQD